MDSLVQLDVQTFLGTGDEEVLVELLADSLQELQTFLQTLLGTTHTYMLPHDVTQLLVDRVNRALTLDVHQTVNLCLNSLLGSLELGQVGRQASPQLLVGQVVLDSIGKYEVTIGQALHKSRSTQTVSTVVREVTLTDSEQTGDSGLQLIVNPNTTHCVVDSGEDHHGVIVLYAINGLSQLTGVNVGNLLVHLEEVAITLENLLDAQTLDRLREVKEYSQTSVVNTEALVATLLSST